MVLPHGRSSARACVRGTAGADARGPDFALRESLVPTVPGDGSRTHRVGGCRLPADIQVAAMKKLGWLCLMQTLDLLGPETVAPIMIFAQTQVGHRVLGRGHCVSEGCTNFRRSSSMVLPVSAKPRPSRQAAWLQCSAYGYVKACSAFLVLIHRCRVCCGARPSFRFGWAMPQHPLHIRAHFSSADSFRCMGLRGHIDVAVPCAGRHTGPELGVSQRLHC